MHFADVLQMCVAARLDLARAATSELLPPTTRGTDRSIVGGGGGCLWAGRHRQSLGLKNGVKRARLQSIEWAMGRGQSKAFNGEAWVSCD